MHCGGDLRRVQGLSEGVRRGGCRGLAQPWRSSHALDEVGEIFHELVLARRLVGQGQHRVRDEVGGERGRACGEPRAAVPSAAAASGRRVRRGQDVMAQRTARRVCTPTVGARGWAGSGCLADTWRTQGWPARARRLHRAAHAQHLRDRGRFGGRIIGYCYQLAHGVPRCGSHRVAQLRGYWFPQPHRASQ